MTSTKKINQIHIILVSLIFTLIIGAFIYFNNTQVINQRTVLNKLTFSLLNSQTNLKQLLSLYQYNQPINIDNLNQITHQQKQFAQQLKQQTPNDPSLHISLTELTHEIKKQTHKINEFKSINAVYQNSINFLPTAMNDCYLSIHNPEQTAQLEQVYMSLSNQLFQNKTTQNLGQLNQSLKQFSNSNISSQCNLLIQHVKVLSKYGSLKQATYQSLVKSPIQIMLFKLKQEYSRFFNRYQQHNHWMTYGIMLLSFLFLSYIFFILNKFFQTHRALKKNIQKLAEQKQLYQMLSLANQSLLKLENESETLQKMADILCHHTGIANCWIGKPNDQFQLEIQAISGEFSEVIKQIVISLDPNDKKHSGASAMAYHTQTPQIINDYLASPISQKWLHYIKQYQVLATASFPIIIQNKPYGVLVLYSHIKGFFTEEIIQTIQEICNDLSVALDKFNLLKIQQKHQEELAISSIAFETNQPIMITNPQGVIIQINQAFTQTTGYTQEEAIGQTPRILKSDQQDKSFYHDLWQTLIKTGHWSGELQNRNKDGSIITIEEHITARYNEKSQITHFIAHMNNITEKRAAETQIAYLSSFDPLTNLIKIDQLLLRIKQKLAQKAPSLNLLFMLNVNRFKQINESLGNKQGDALLQAIAKRLTELNIPHASDVLPARISGDEFAILISLSSGLESDKHELIHPIVLLLEQTMNTAFEVQQHQLDIDFSIGLTQFKNTTPLTENEILQQANIALHRARQNPLTQTQFFEPSMQQKATETFKLEEAIRQAVKNQEFTMYYQPQIDPITHQYIGAESLIRWIMPDGKMIGPDKFIPILEETGLIIPVSYWILETVIQQTQQLNDFKKSDYTVSVNLSGIQFQEEDLVDNILKIIQKYNFPANRLLLEVTETAIVEDLKTTTQKLSAFAEEGIRIAIDDFGTGYSSMAYLKNMPIYELKIDKTFIDDIQHTKDRAIVETIINLAKGLGMSSIAEGVEGGQQLETLKQLGCHHIQGYYYSKPLPFNELQHYIENLNPS